MIFFNKFIVLKNNLNILEKIEKIKEFLNLLKSTVDKFKSFFNIWDKNWYTKLEITKDEKIYVTKKVYLIYFHSMGFFTQISKGWIPYVIITELE